MKVSLGLCVTPEKQAELDRVVDKLERKVGKILAECVTCESVGESTEDAPKIDYKSIFENANIRGYTDYAYGESDIMSSLAPRPHGPDEHVLVRVVSRKELREIEEGLIAAGFRRRMHMEEILEFSDRSTGDVKRYIIDKWLR